MAVVSIEGYSFSYPSPGKPSVSPLGGQAANPAGDQRGARGQALHPAPAQAAPGPRPVLSGIDLTVEEGAFCCVLGPTGCGKTTLLRALKPELTPHGTHGGTVRVLGRTLIEGGRPTGSLGVRESAGLVGYVMQDPEAQIVCDTVWHELAFGLENLGTPQGEMRRRVAEVAHFFGIEPWMHAATATLSGGQKQLVNLAAALALQPRLLVLDEPTAQLDPDALKRFLFMLGRVNRELKTTVVMATHSPEDVAPYATQRFALGQGHPLGTRADVEGALSLRWKAAEARLANAKVVLAARDVCVRYERAQPWVLRNLDVKVARGSVHAFVGGNGCGKTTLLKLLAGVLKPQRGRVANQAAARQAFLPQDPKALFVCDTCGEELAEWRKRCGYAPRDEQAMLARFGLECCEGQHPYDLSGGQRQCLALAKLLLCDPQLLFLDEPTKGLDPAACAQVARTVRSLAAEGRTVVLVTHDLDFALATADAVSLVFDGELACTEPAGTFFARSIVWRPNDASRLFGELLAGEPPLRELP